MTLSVNDKARLYRELGKLFAASFPMDKSIALLTEQHSSGTRHEFLNGLQAGLASKLSFAESLKQQNGHFATELELSLIDSGERSGRLAQACEHLAHYFETWNKSIREARGALIYPMLLLHVGIILPEISRYMMLSSIKEIAVVPAILSRLAIFWTLIVATGFAWKSLSKAATKSETIDSILNRIPIIGAVRRHWALARFCQVFHSALLAALRISECLHMAGEGSQSGTLRSGAGKAAFRVELSDTLAEGLANSHSFPQLFVNSIATSEASGGLDREFERWAQAETDMAVEAQKRAAEWIPKGLYFLVLGYVATRIISFASDYFGTIMNFDSYMN
ncbi:MAG: type II secretion system F family protein [Verrucomicrobiaceae bacterium]